MKQDKIREKVVIVLGVLTTATLLAGVFCLFILKMNFIGNEYAETVDYDEGWSYSDGDECDLLNLDFNKTGVIEKDAVSGEIGGNSLCFETSNLVFDIYMDDELIYDFNPDLGGLYGKYYGEYIHTVKIPAFNGIKSLKIEYTALSTEGRWTQFRCMKAGNSWSYIKDIVETYAPRFAICFLIFMFGCVLVAFGIIFGKTSMGSIETISLGVLAMVLSVWTNSGTRIFTLITGNSAAVRAVEHFTLVLLPMPALSFTAYLTRSFKNVFIWTSAALTCINFAINVILVSSGVTDYHEILIYTHVNILIGFIIVIYLIISAVKRKVYESGGVLTMLSAFVVLMIGGLLDFINYYMSNTIDTARFTRIGLFIFVGILGFHEVRESIHVSEKSLDADEKNRLAHIDGLTGLFNRLAFSEREAEIAKKKNGMCVFIEFDVNNLKKVNDNYGHTEGDKHIIGAANAITQSFGQYGNIYRVGGDEFIGIIEGYECEDMAKAGAEELIKYYNDYNEKNNPPVKLEIAYGIALYDYDKGDPEQAERIADDRMYECKKRLKEASGISSSVNQTVQN
ncbi:MAG: diguanylate cyclase [Lachnospiraceae bacterium]|nr:diguanylate cyclase [Lachnospiraceae bacterium]